MAVAEILNPANYEWSILGLPRAFIGFIGFLLPCILYLRNHRNSLYQLYFFIVIPTFIWQFAYAWMLQAPNAEVAEFWSSVGRIGTYFLPAAIYAFGVFHTKSYRQLPVAIAFLVLSFGISLLVYHPGFFDHVHRYAWGYYGIHGPWHRVQIVLTVAAYFGLFYNLARDFFQSRSQNQRKLNWLFMVAFAGGALAALEYLPGYGYDLRPLGFLAVSFWSLVLLGAILKYRNADVETIMMQTFTYLFLTAIVVVFYAIFMGLTKWILIGGFDWNQLFLTSFALLAIFPLSEFFRQRVQKFVTRYFHQHQLTDQETLSEFIEGIKELTNERLLLEDLVRVVKQTTGVTHVAIYLATENRSAYVFKESRGGEPNVISLPGNHAVLLWLKSHNRVLDKDALLHDGKDPEIRDSGVQLMKEMGFDLLIPMVIGVDLIGFMGLGRRVTGIPFGVNDMALLRLVGKNAAVAVSNALLFEEVTQKNQALLRLDREKANFLANTSHELRTPLHGITGIAEAMMEGTDGPVTEKQRHHIRLIHESGKALSDLVEKLLDLQRLESQQMEFEILAFHVKDLIAMVTPIVEGILRNKPEITLRVAMDSEDEPLPKVYGDVRLIRQVLLNLLGNAAKFTERGVIEILAWRGKGPRGERKEAQDANRFLTIAVRDTGIGIRPEERELVFQRFRQAPSAGRKYGGTGLGLAIVQKIVEQHHGRVWLESEVGKGSTFYFSLPQFPFEVETVRSTEESDTSMQSYEVRPLTEDRLYRVPKAEGLIQLAKGHGELIFVVDDNPVNIEVVRACLESQGYQVDGSLSSKEGWEEIVARKPDLVILDVMMPGMNGFEFCHRLRSREDLKRIPVIMVTARGSLEDKVYGFNVGANAYLTKPFNREELIAIVNTFVRMNQMATNLEQAYRELKAISEVASDINQELGLDRLLVKILDRVLDLVNAERGAIFTKEENARDIGLRFSRGFASQKRSDVDRQISHRMIEKVHITGEALVVPDIRINKQLAYTEKSGSLICLPLRLREKIYGSLYLYSAKPNQMNEDLLRVLTPLCEQISSSIHNARLYDLAVTDDLTNLYLKRYFYECLQLEYERAQKEMTRFSLIMIDIDHFKSFNDTYGHLLGDNVLVQVAEILRDHCRISDVAARYGGEEFVVLLRNTELEEATAFANRYRLLVEKASVFHRGERVKVTVSVGVCSFESPVTVVIEDLIGEADLELYKAKANGRNCVSSRKHKPPEEDPQLYVPTTTVIAE